MPRQSAPGDMTSAYRNRLRNLQDRFLKHPQVSRFVSVYGDGWSLFDAGNGPTAKNLREFVYPEYAEEMERLLKKWKEPTP